MVGEAIYLKLYDTALDKDPAKINISGAITKTGASRITFASNKVEEMLNELYEGLNQTGYFYY